MLDCSQSSGDAVESEVQVLSSPRGAVNVFQLIAVILSSCVIVCLSSSWNDSCLSVKRVVPRNVARKAVAFGMGVNREICFSFCWNTLTYDSGIAAEHFGKVKTRNGIKKKIPRLGGDTQPKKNQQQKTQNCCFERNHPLRSVRRLVG